MCDIKSMHEDMPKGKGGTSPTMDHLGACFLSSGLALGRRLLSGKSRNAGLNKGRSSSKGSLPVICLLDGVKWPQEVLLTSHSKTPDLLKRIMKQREMTHFQTSIHSLSDTRLPLQVLCFMAFTPSLSHTLLSSFKRSKWLLRHTLSLSDTGCLMYTV